jgi:signal transduction histidine kinase
MNKRFLLHIIAPTIAISILLFSLGILAAWNVQRQQKANSELVALEMRTLTAATDLNLAVQDLHLLLGQYLRKGDRDYLDQLARMKPAVEQELAPLVDLSRTADERQLLTALQAGVAAFFDKLAQVDGTLAVAQAHQAAVELDDILDEQVLKPTRSFMQSNEQLIDRADQANRQTSAQMFEAFLLLGVCGGAAGLVAGLAIARGVRRSMLNLDVSVRGAADKLREVVGPVKISNLDGLQDLESGLKEVEERIAVVVERLQQRELESLRNQQFAAVGQLAAGLAHELRNPLMPMKMLVQRALARPQGPGLTQRQLQVLDEEILRLEGLVQEFLDFAKPQALQRKRMDVVGVVRQAIELVAARAGIQHVDLYTRAPSTPLYVDADPLRLRQVLLNLLLNSLDAQPDGGRIMLEVLPIAADAPDDVPATILVTDDGPGIPEELLERVFEPFVSTKETGTGLGLTICRRIIADHGGRLDIIPDHRQGRGTQFQILLPRAAGRESLAMFALQSEDS